MTNTWIDVTKELAGLSHELGFLEVVKHPDLTLEETMHAHQINDPKIDPKFDMSETHTISRMIKDGKIRSADSLSIPQIKNIYAEIIKLQSLVLQTNPLPQTIYTFTYLYDDDLWKDAIFIAPLVESINTLGAYIYDLHKESCSVKEDDLSFSTFSFKKNIKMNDQVIEMFLKAEKQLENRLKTQKQNEVLMSGKQLIGFMKLRRSIHTLIKFLNKIYDNKSQSKIQNQLKIVRKRIVELKSMIQKDNLKELKPEGVFSLTISKSLRSQFGSRDVKEISLIQAFNQIQNALNQFDLFLPPPTKISQYRNRLDILSRKPMNLWSKAYIKFNLFNRQNYLMNTVKTEEALAGDIKEWGKGNISQQVKNDAKFQNIIRSSAPSIAETLFRLSSRNSRWFWEISKSYDDFNSIIHLGNQIDSKYMQKKKQVYVSSWYYNWATYLMSRQLLCGFQEGLYEISEYPYVAYQLEHILHVNYKNFNYFLNRLDKTFMDSFYENTLSKKKKKLLSDIEKKYFADSIFNKGLHYYFRAFYRLLIILQNRKHIIDPLAEQLELRVNNRFRIFKNVLFLKKITYELYKKEIELVAGDEQKILQEANSLLKGGKNIFNLFGQFDDGETNCNQREDAVVLQKLCVKLSLVVMTLKMKQPKTFTVKKQQSKYPQIQIQ